MYGTLWQSPTLSTSGYAVYTASIKMPIGFV